MKHLLAAAALALTLAGPARADDATRERTAILATVDRFFVAMTAHDAKAWSEIFVDDASTFTQAYQPDGSVKLRRGTVKDMIANLPSGPPMSERIWKPTVMVRGPMAVVWAPYEFKLDGKSHHCGIDVFDLLKVDGTWRMANAMWTAEPKACAELGADKN